MGTLSVFNDNCSLADYARTIHIILLDKRPENIHRMKFL